MKAQLFVAAAIGLVSLQEAGWAMSCHSVNGNGPSLTKAELEAKTNVIRGLVQLAEEIPGGRAQFKIGSAEAHLRWDAIDRVEVSIPVFTVKSETQRYTVEGAFNESPTNFQPSSHGGNTFLTIKADVRLVTSTETEIGQAFMARLRAQGRVPNEKGYIGSYFISADLASRFMPFEADRHLIRAIESACKKAGLAFVKGTLLDIKSLSSADVVLDAMPRAVEGTIPSGLRSADYPYTMGTNVTGNSITLIRTMNLHFSQKALNQQEDLWRAVAEALSE
ncbi:MAG: hypothetical protein C5B49_03755 [Bdellovibrio sp.]|nr:MAG: hypothetical protein C5B49_03755 [Bdellovibrio sp.]